MKKRVVCLLHIPKSAGSSVWSTIGSQTGIPNERIAIADAYASACLALGSENSMETPRASRIALSKILQSFRSSPQSLLFVHYHTPGLPDFGSDLDVDIIIVSRNPTERWKSGLRHWLGGSILTRNFLADYPDQTDAVFRLAQRPRVTRVLPALRYLWALRSPSVKPVFPFDFFSSTFSWGVDVHLGCSFGQSWYQDPKFEETKKIRIFAFDTTDLCHHGAFSQFLFQQYGIGVDTVKLYEGTITKKGKYHEASERLINEVPAFSRVLERRIRREDIANRRLHERFSYANRVN